MYKHNHQPSTEFGSRTLYESSRRPGRPPETGGRGSSAKATAGGGATKAYCYYHYLSYYYYHYYYNHLSPAGPQNGASDFPFQF